MIVLVTDSIEPWSIYIWDQFVRTNKLEAEYKFCTYDQFPQISDPKSCSLIIEYSSYQKTSQSLFIPRLKHFTTDDYVWIRNDFPIYSDTFDQELKEFDIFFNAFVHLSRLGNGFPKKKGNEFILTHLNTREKIKESGKFRLLTTYLICLRQR